MSSRREGRLAAAFFAAFIVSVAALRDWLHGDEGATEASEPTETAAEPERGPPAPGPVVDGAQLVAVHGVHDRWRGPSHRALGPDEKWIAVDVELTVAADAGFAFEDLAVLVDGLVESREPVVQRLDADGEPVAWDDPALSGSERYRVLLGWVVQGDATEVGLGYGTAELTGAPIALDGA